MSFTSQNHYVPQWYQRRFHSGDTKESKVHYLDLSPEKIKRGDGGFYYRNAIRRLGTKECFKQEHLYTLFFKDYPSDVIEREFFGAIDDIGARAVQFFCDYQFTDEAGDAFQNIMRFMDAQKLRTPKGLDYLRLVTGRNATNKVLRVMRHLWQMHITIWTEGVWEVVTCHHQPTKFLLSDHPITTYNKRLFPGSKECVYPRDPDTALLGTHTIFPLDLNHCLIITNLGYVRNPNANVLKMRENPRYFQNAIFDLRKVQTGREISNDDVIAINYVIKVRAKRYIAAANKDWLYPEKQIKNRMWHKLGSKYFLMPDPRKVSFSTGIFMGGGSGGTLAQDEYGRIPNDEDEATTRQRDKEWKTFHAFRDAWDALYGRLSDEEFQKWVP